MKDTSVHSPRPRRAALRLPHLLPGGAALAATAGYVNSVVLGFFHAPVSHMTGAVSRVGIDVAERGGRDIWAGVAIIVGFLLGSILAGLLVGARRLAPNRRFGIALALEGVLLAVATLLLRSDQRFGLPFAALACGLQNTMGSSYCGLQIRTTHVTGMVSDLGMMLGHWMRRQPVDFRKFKFFAAVVLAFGLGGYAGAVADIRFGPTALLLPAAGCGIAGIAYSLLVVRLGARILPPPPGSR